MNIQQVIGRSSLCSLVLIGLTLFASPVAAQVFDSGPSDPALFDTVINVPTDPNIGADESIGGDGLTTQLNLSDGGDVGNRELRGYPCVYRHSDCTIGRRNAFSKLHALRERLLPQVLKTAAI